MKIISSQNGEITLLFTDMVQSHPSSECLVSQILFNVIRENKILAKIFGITVVKVTHNVHSVYL